MDIMNSHPKNFSECIKRESYEVQNKFNQDKFIHIEKKLERLHDEAINDLTSLRKDLEEDLKTAKEEIQKEINYKNKSNRDFIVYVATGLGVIIGTVWAKIIELENNFSQHTHKLWHDGASSIAENVDKIMCKIFELC